ncbi:MAG: hypothetical protein WBV77_07045 [Solirubrobacteraceae bacterium]
MTTQPPPSFPTPRRARLAAASLLASVLSLVGLALLAPISTANAGELVQRSCSFGGTEYIAPEDWEAEANGGYVGLPPDNCERYYNGGGLAAYAAGWNGTKPDSGTTWRYKAPTWATIAGGDLAVTMTARDGGAVVGARVKEQPVTLAVCDNPGCHGYEKILPITASGASELWETAYCSANTEGICPAENFNEHEGNGHEAAEVNITSAQIVLSTSANPAGSGFDGTLLGGPLTGTGTLNFKATDPGPGVYQARAKIDGQQLWAATPNLYEGKCVSTGSLEGVRAFNYAQPCPSETAVHAEINTAALPDGTHALTVEVEDAAGDVTTVYSGTLTTLNHATVFTPTPTPTPAPVERGPCSGTPCVEAAKLTATPGEARSFTKALKHSTVTLTGRLTTTSGAPIKDAQVKLLQQIVGSASVTPVATATTTADGSWSLKAPAGPSRLLRAAFYSHTLDAVPAATVDFHENVPAIVSIHAPRHVNLGQFFMFSGQLTGGYIPPGGEEVQVQIKYGGKWRELQLVDANSHGRWKYRYAFTLEPGTKWAFRAIAVRNGSYPFTSHESATIHVAVRR